MKVILKNSTLTFAKGLWTKTGKTIKVSSSEVTSVAFPVGKSCNVMGRNLVDASRLKFHKILNDSGVEVNDSSSYFDNFIPMLGGGLLRTNFGFSRIYLYDEGKNFVSRYGVSGNNVSIPSSFNNHAIYWAKVQTAATQSQTTLDTMIVTKDEDAAPESFEAFSSNTDGTIYSPYSWVYADDLSEITITEKVE